MEKPSKTADEAAEWLKRIAQSGDKSAFVALFNYFAPRLKTWMRRQNLTAAEAEDLVQDVMFQLWQRAAQFDEKKARASTWIYTIARNRLIDVRRKEKSSGHYLASPLSDGADPGTDEPQKLMELGADRAQIQKALAGLPPEQRDLIEESYFNDQSHGDIAAQHHLPLGTVKSRLRLALKHLRKNLGGEET